MARIYFAGGEHPVAWNELRYFGPTTSRFDHHQRNAEDEPCLQDRGILYAADHVRTCIAECFQSTRRINRARGEPWLVVFTVRSALRLVDLTGSFVTRLGASTAMHSGRTPTAREWARWLYEGYPDTMGIAYCSSMNGNAPAYALTERVLNSDALPDDPDFNRPLVDPTLVNLLDEAATVLAYGLT